MCVYIYINCSSLMVFQGGFQTVILPWIAAQVAGHLPYHRASAGTKSLQEIHGARVGRSADGDATAYGSSIDSKQGGFVWLG